MKMPIPTSSLAFVAGQFLRERTYPLRFQYRLQRRLREWTPANGDTDCALREALEGLRRTPPYPRMPKGAPDVVGMKRAVAQRVCDVLSRPNSSENARPILKELRWAASVDARDPVAFAAFGLAFQRVHREVLAALAEHLTPLIAVHLSCAPRLDRALRSVESFESAELSHVIVVGDESAELFSFDPGHRILRVPCGDGYSQLPMKAVSAYFILSLLPQVRAVLKLDDDHRMADREQLHRAMQGCAATRAPTLFGHVDRASFYGGHNRGWHLGKCADEPANSQPFAFPGVLAWVGGASGYVLNRAALRHMTWAYTYFEQHLQSALYEDQLVSDLVVRLGGRLRPLDTARFLSAVGAY